MRQKISPTQLILLSVFQLEQLMKCVFMKWLSLILCYDYQMRVFIMPPTATSDELPMAAQCICGSQGVVAKGQGLLSIQIYLQQKMNRSAILFTFIAILVGTSQIAEMTDNYKITSSECESDCCRTLTDRSPMTYTYYQKTGRLVGGAGNYKVDTLGYSGQGKGYLNPDEECNHSEGPLPASTYKLGYCKNKMHQTTDRPCSFYLDPQRPEEICGRGDFFIHGCQCCTPGDDSEPPAGGCSAGCVVISYDNRRRLRLGDTLIVKHNQQSQAEVQ